MYDNGQTAATDLQNPTAVHYKVQKKHVALIWPFPKLCCPKWTEIQRNPGSVPVNSNTVHQYDPVKAFIPVRRDDTPPSAVRGQYK